MKTYSRINTSDVEHGSRPTIYNSFIFSDDISKWISSGKVEKDKEWCDKRRKGDQVGGRREVNKW